MSILALVLFFQVKFENRADALLQRGRELIVEQDTLIYQGHDLVDTFDSKVLPWLDELDRKREVEWQAKKKERDRKDKIFREQMEQWNREETARMKAIEEAW